MRLVALVALLTLVVTAACSGGRATSDPPVTTASGTGAPCVPAATSAASPAVPAGTTSSPPVPGAPGPTAAGAAGPTGAPSPTTTGTAADAAGRGNPAGPGGAAAGEKVPDLALACFTGGAQVRLRALGRPAVLNLWASWCPPCRRELPALNAYAQRGTVLVIGVATDDRREGTGAVIDEFGLGFPTLYDREGRLLKAIGSVPLPVTLFVSADGTVTYTHRAGALDTAGFERLAREHLGVTA